MLSESSRNRRLPAARSSRSPLTDSLHRRQRLSDSKIVRLLLVLGFGSLGLYSMDRYLFGRALTNEQGTLLRAPTTTPQKQKQQQKQQQRQQPQLQQQVNAHQGGNRPSNKKNWMAGAKTLPDGSPRPIYKQPQQLQERCAICLWGLPRAFSTLVLPTLIQNVLIPNAPYHCDFFVHYHDLQTEAPSRSGHGGQLNPKEILQLTEAARAVGSNATLTTTTTYEPVVQFTKTTDLDFVERRGEFINVTRTATDAKGRYTYFPWKEKSFQYPQTTDNIIRMWDGLAAVSQLLQDYEAEHGIQYTRLAMLRSDVAFVTPIDLYSIPGHAEASRDQILRTAVVPGFAKWPVNDRGIYGPAPAVRIWANERFDRIDEHVREIAKTHPGHGMQDEYYLDLTIFPAIHALGIDIVEDETMCFLRTRVDESIWLNDCGNVNDNQRLIETMIQRPCRQSRLDENIKKGVVQLECRQGIMDEAVVA